MGTGNHAGGRFVGFSSQRREFTLQSRWRGRRSNSAQSVIATEGPIERVLSAALVTLETVVPIDKAGPVVRPLVGGSLADKVWGSRISGRSYQDGPGPKWPGALCRSAVYASSPRHESAAPEHRLQIEAGVPTMPAMY